MHQLREEEYNKGFNPQLWRKLMGYIAIYRKDLSLLVLVMIAVAAIEAIFPLFTRYAVDHIIIPGTTAGLPRFIVLYLSLVALQSLNVWLFISRAGKIETGVSHDIRSLGFKRLQELSMSYHQRKPTGWLMARLTSDTMRLSEALAWGLVDIAWGGGMMLAITIAMFALDWRLALIALTVLPVLLVISLIFQKKILRASRTVRRLNSRITGLINEGIMGARTTKSLVREDENLKEYAVETGRMRDASIRAAVLSALFLPLMLSLGSAGTALALGFGGVRVITATLTYGTLVAFLSYTVQFFEPVRELARIFAEFQSAQAAAERVISLIETEPEIQDTPEVRRIFGDFDAPRPRNWPTIRGAITFRQVTFSYQDGEEILKNFNLQIGAGRTVALVGETGSGKTTIVNLICRFYEPSAGQILIDGTDYRQRSLHWLRSQLGYVLQDPHLFSGTIRENIAYGNPTASEEDIIGSARLVNAHRFITALEDGYETQVGESGDLLSTGQKQLISFARAISGRPGLLILDEATSSIDTEMEQVIQKAINRILTGRTSIIIAHRLSTIRRADRILVLHKGQIVEEGTHQELLATGGKYRHLYESQFI